MIDRVMNIIRSATELNLRYTSTVLYLSRDYLKAFNGILQKTASTPEAQPSATASNRPPLLIVGRSNEPASAAFPINNTLSKDITVNLIIQGELDDKQVRLDPASLNLKAGESAIVRVIANINERLAEDRNYSGAVVAPGLSSEAIPFVVRRLPGQTSGVPASARKTSGRNSKATPT